MIAAEIALRYQGGDSLVTLMHEYHIGKDRLRHLLGSMGATIRPSGCRVHQNVSMWRAPTTRVVGAECCQRCEILLGAAPAGDAGLCGWCKEGR